MDTLYWRVWVFADSPTIMLDDSQTEVPLIADVQASVATFADYNAALRYAEAEVARTGYELITNTIPF